MERDKSKLSRELDRMHIDIASGSEHSCRTDGCRCLLGTSERIEEGAGGGRGGGGGGGGERENSVSLVTLSRELELRRAPFLL